MKKWIARFLASDIVLITLTLGALILALNIRAGEAHGSDLVSAIHQVETSGRLGPIRGDGGAALGPLQIHRACWVDARMPDGSYEDCANLAYAKRVFARYMERYATQRRLGRPVTDQDRARIWNGGPNGYKKRATLGYWNKVRKELNNA